MKNLLIGFIEKYEHLIEMGLIVKLVFQIGKFWQKVENFEKRIEKLEGKQPVETKKPDPFRWL